MNFRKAQSVRLVIADDHPIFRDGLRRLLEAEADLKVLGEASDGAEAVKLPRQFKPDILLLDLAMPKHPGLEALRELSVPANATPVRVILLTAAAEKSQIVEALQLGARGVVLKDSATQLLLKAIHTVMAGEYWVGRESVSNLVQYLRTLMQSSHDEARQKKFGLTPRELEIVSAGVAGDFYQGNSRILQDQRRYGQAPSQQHLRQVRRLDPTGTCSVCRESGPAYQEHRLKAVPV